MELILLVGLVLIHTLMDIEEIKDKRLARR